MRFPFIFLAIFAAFVESCSWNACPKWSTDSKDVIHVHIIPHTHDDMGWIKTVDDYYTGAKKKLVNVGVQFIYDSVVDELLKDEKRKFVFAEVGFLTRWLHQHQNDKKRIETFKSLVEKGQIEFIGGGWVQPDEASSHYIDLIDQYTLGLHYLNETFGHCGKSKVAWQIDPFGHSKEHANILAQIGYEALFLGRMHFNELQGRIDNKTLEFIWSGSDDQKTNIFTGGFYTNSYAPPSNFCFDTLCADDPVVADPSLDGFNLPEMVASFIKMIHERSSAIRHNQLLFLMGGDFQYSNANMYFSQMDLLFDEINRQTSTLNVTIAYSTPSCYMQSLKQQSFHVPVKNDDFFPYASSEHNYWTGYFTSKPALKGLIRRASAILQLVRQLRVSANLGSDDVVDVEDKIERSIALAQHHDAVTGTSKEAVTVDYERRLLQNIDSGMKLVQTSFKTLTGLSNDIKLVTCPLLNETVCTFTDSDSVVTLTFFNGDSKILNDIVRVPVYSNNVLIQDGDNKNVASEVFKSFQLSDQLSNNKTAPFEVHFPVSIPPLGFRTFFLTKLQNRDKIWLRKRFLKTKTRDPDQVVFIENNLVRLEFAPTGLVEKWIDKSSNRTYQFTQEFLYYTGDGVNGTEARTGAYIFRPNGTSTFNFTQPIKIEYYTGSLVQEMRQHVSPWVSQVIRLKRNQSLVEFDYIVGPIPKEEKNPIAKEIITRYTVKGLDSEKSFFTDSNGRQLMHRVLNQSPCFARNLTEPISSNYYPITNRVIIKDPTKQLTVLTDRSHGASSLEDGQIEVMLHRRAFYDDGWGVEEPLDEPGEDGRGLVVRGIHWVSLSEPESREHRTRAPSLLHRPVLVLSNINDVTDYINSTKTEFSLLNTVLPEQIQVLTLKSLGPKTILLRLEHVFQGNEDPVYARPVNVGIKDLFKNLNLESVIEFELAASTRRRRLSSTDITLSPMEIRTFHLNLA